MKIKINNGRPASESDIAILEHSLGRALPSAYLNFVRENDAAEPESNIFKIGSKCNCGVNRFIPVRGILKEKKDIRDLPKEAFPIADAAGGNSVFIDLAKKGAVFFWDHEEHPPENIIKVADNFTDFLHLLEPDATPVILEPGQVISAWKHPDSFRLVADEQSRLNGDDSDATRIAPEVSNPLFAPTKFLYPNPSLSESQINGCEASCGLCFPQALRESYLTANGGEPHPYALNNIVETFVSEFLPILTDRQTQTTALDVYQDLVEKQNLVPTSYFPFAADSLGNYFFTDTSTSHGAIYFYDCDANDEAGSLVDLELGVVDFWKALRPE